MKALKRYIYNWVDRHLNYDGKDILAMQYLAPLSKTYLPWTVAAMRPSGLVKVLNEIVVNRRSYIVECGGGISTYYIASLIKERGGHLYTIEHDKEWSNILREFIAIQNLDEFVSIIVAPLVKTSLAINECSWYNEDIIRDAVGDLKIDLLLVDGPPANQDQKMYSRYPAVPFFKPFLSEDYTIILDDINRKGEQEILQKWEKYLEISFSQYLINGSIAIGRSKTSWTIA
ncbi:class I SAM-dependent methyltransferase [Limnofasciculus baicalensis]|uniref:Class I SAM-dependent methyltransferase n=1 Tax=Limnofasciculus baicalensis BBK-W-15 TaxID=2699891 RepID=A0AAE3KM38_9CYAN|nr:class I SAM-dependent methyltransferase [Limnofasciculus baicalensis]MCP2728789.1 class I SAM-dependent methyltransferase [Limnofasciculus baicalensis BBK-W-15]